MVRSQISGGSLQLGAESLRDEYILPKSDSDIMNTMENDNVCNKLNEDGRRSEPSQVDGKELTTLVSETWLSKMVEEMVQKTSGFSCLSMHASACCEAAQASIRATATMANGRGGLAAVLSVGSHSITWGPRRCEWLCDAWHHRKELDCGGCAALMQKLVEQSDECFAGQVSVYRVSVIIQSSTHEAACWGHLFSTSNRSSYGKWIHPSGKSVYHECLAIHNPTTGLRVFDPASRAWFLPSNEATDVGVVFAWHIHTDNVSSRHELCFGGHMVPTSCWFTLMPPVASANVRLVGLSSSKPIMYQPTSSQQQQLIVYISGVSNNNDNPSPGLGVARSLRNGFRFNETIALQLVAADFSLESVGLGDAVFDQRIVFPSWEHCSATKHTEGVIELLQSNSSLNCHTLYISCLDVETELLARELPKYLAQSSEVAKVAARILIPSSAALARTHKPHIHAASTLGFRISDVLELPQEYNNEPWVQAWCVSKGFPVIVKGQYYDAVVANSWPQVQSSLLDLQKLWGSSSTFLQQSVVGSEGSIVFSAYDGQLLAAALTHKCMVTSSKKMWSSQVSALPIELLESLRVIVRELRWTGGSEVEFIESVDGSRYLIDWNPRFPAWIYGAVAAVDINLPLALVGVSAFKLFGINILSQELLDKFEQNHIISPTSSGDFVRTVIEQRNHGVQPLITAGPNDSGVLCVSSPITSKGGNTGRPHPSRNTSAAKLLKQDASMNLASSSRPSREQCCLDNLPSMDRLKQVLANDEKRTPLIFFDHESMCCTIDTMKQTICAVLERMDDSYSKHVNVNLALSIKTNPVADILTTGLNKGMIAEAISLLEIRMALVAGFASKNIILNGPGKWFDRNNNDEQALVSLMAVIADSAEELDQLSDAVVCGRILNNGSAAHLMVQGAEYIGVRLAVPGTGSRFGIDVGNPEILKRVAMALQRLPTDQKTAFHFHCASSTLGIPAWIGAVKAALQAAVTIDRMGGRVCSMFDFGGGWAANTFNETTAVAPLLDIFSMAMLNLPALKELVFEPGKAVVQSAGVMVTRVLSVREASVQLSESQVKSNDDDDGQTEGRLVILDTSIAELPDINSHKHQLMWMPQEYNSSNTWQPIVSTGGMDAIYGRICMEHDILARSVELPEHLKAGDFVAIGSVGAYDVSMAYNFGNGAASVLPIHKLKIEN